MPPDFTYPGVYIQEISSGLRAITGVSTSIAAFVGWTPRGDADEAKLVESWSDFERTFGGLHSQSLLSHAVSHFFANGGHEAYVVRLTHRDGSTGEVIDRPALRPNTRAFEKKLLAEGLERLTPVHLFNLLCVPGETRPAVIASLQRFCRDRRAFLIVDCEREATLGQLQGGPDSMVTGPDGINSAIYFPWIKAPSQKQSKRLGDFPPCGFVAGVYARMDATRGLWKAPAGTHTNLIGASAPTVRLTDVESDSLNTRAINTIRTLNTVGTVLWGTRTLRGNEDAEPEWKYIHVRRFALFLEESIYRGIKWVVFEPNAEPLWVQIRSSIDAFMMGLFRHGAFQGTRPEEAFFVKCDRETTTQDDVNNGRVNILVGFAALRPAEFAVIKIQQLCGSIST